MANATVEKLKTLGLRHGEKAAVAAAAAVTLLLVVKGWSKPTIDVTPDQIKKSAEAAQNNLNRPQSKESIIQKLDGDQLVVVNFSKKVDEQDPAKRPKPQWAFNGPPWVQPEPGAGLIREMPTLLPPGELYATAGRGAIEILERDEDDQLIYVPMKKDAQKKSTPKKAAKRRRNQGGMGGRGGAMGGGMMASMMGGMGGAGGGQTKSEIDKQKAKKARELEAQRKAGMFVGGDEADEEDSEEDKQIAAKAKEGKEPKTSTKGYRWVALVGTLDHKKLKENYVKALKDPNAAPHYLRLDLERQSLGDDGEWSDWELVGRTLADRIDRSFTTLEEELAPDNVLLDPLVARLPWLNVGYYRGVHVASLVPKEKREMPKAPDESETAGMGMMGMGGRFSAMMGGGMGGESGMGNSSMMGGGMGGRGRSMMMMMGGGEGGGYGASTGGGGGPEDTNFEKSDAPKIMVRALDYTVEPDTAYRYRARIVVRNPNLKWETIAPGVDNTTKELAGPWSEPLDPVRVPADVTTYVVRRSPLADGQTPGAVQFQVVRFVPETGLTVVKPFDEAPGAIIGEPLAASIPKDDGKGLISRRIDFTSRQILVDSAASARPLDPVGMKGASLDTPALALVLRNDGQLVVRDEARDTRDPEMRSLKEIYDETVKDAEAGGKKQPTSPMMGGGMGMGRMGMSGAQ